MSTKIEAMEPIKVKINWKMAFKVLILWLVSLILLIILIVSSVNILIYYIVSIKNNGWLSPETLKFAIYLVIGTYFFLVLDRKKIYDAFGIKSDLRIITIEETNINTNVSNLSKE